MKVVIQRVSSASVSISNQIHSSIGNGLLVLLGVGLNDSVEDVDWLVGKILNMRIFNDQDGVMNCSLLDVKGEILVVSQFTLHARTKNGNRPSYMDAAPGEISVPLYELFLERVSDGLGRKAQAGVFGADMQVQLVNNGPVTIVLDTKHKI